MPTPDETNSFLYLMITSNGPPQINWDAVCTEFSINFAAANMRWYRVKQAMEAGKKSPLKDSHAFLWSLLKNSKVMNSGKDKAAAIVDWKPIAKKCNTTVGAAAARFYRMRKAWEKEKQNAEDAAVPDTTYKACATGTPKRKRAAPAKKISPKAYDDQEDVPFSDEEPASGSESLVEGTPKKRVRGMVKDEEDLPTNDLSIYDNRASVPESKGFANAGEPSKFAPFRGFGVAGMEDLFFGGNGEDENGEVEERDELGGEREREDLLQGIGSWVEQEELRVPEKSDWMDEI